MEPLGGIVRQRETAQSRLSLLVDLRNHGPARIHGVAERCELAQVRGCVVPHRAVRLESEQIHRAVAVIVSGK